MALFSEPVKEIIVDALEEGKIVRVSEAYARREGLTILRTVSSPEQQEKFAALARSQKLQQVKESPFESLRKPLRTKNDALAGLHEHFHWEILQLRKQRNLTRKQLAQAVGASESEMKMLENGVLPSDDFVLISKVERYFGVNLRKDASVHAPAAHLLRKASAASAPEPKKAEEPEENGDALLGKEDLLDDNFLDDEPTK